MEEAVITETETTELDELKLIDPDSEMLKRAPGAFDFELDNAEELSEQLIDAMKKLGGVGLSANQVGIDKSVFVIGDGADFVKTFFNPLVVGVSEETEVMKEGCLSFPGLWLMVSRPKQVSIKYTDIKGEEIIETYEDVTARVILHEYDHMLGFNFTQRVSRIKLERAIKAFNKKLKKHQRHLALQAANINK